MGCHGIGVTRLVAAAAACLSTENQLRWPRIIAPYDVVFCVDTKRPESVTAAHNLYDALAEGPGEKLDLLLDDRQQDVSLGWKLRDAFAIGYPVVVVLGRALEKGMVEVRSTSTGYGQGDVKLEDAPEHIRSVLRGAAKPKTLHS
jgi:prolyl-tRNA synthetase